MEWPILEVEKYFWKIEQNYKKNEVEKIEEEHSRIKKMRFREPKKKRNENADGRGGLNATRTSGRYSFYLTCLHLVWR